MEDYRSRSYGYGEMQIGSYYRNLRPSIPPTSSNFQDMRSYSASYAQAQMGYSNNNKDSKSKKDKITSGSSSSSSSSSSLKSWSFSDPEFQRKKRVASYKVYGVEGRMKGSFRKSFRWLKDKYSQVLYGRW